MLTAKLIGMNSSRYKQFKASLEDAIKATPFDVRLVEINDLDDILSYPLSSIPAVLINEEVIFNNGYTPNKEDFIREIYLQMNKQFPMKNIIVPIDFSNTSKQAYWFAQQLALEHDSTLKLVHFAHVFIDPNMPAIDNMDLELDQAIQKLQDFSLEHRLSPMKKEMITIEAEIGFAATGILQYSNQSETDMIIMGTTGESNLSRQILGSVSVQVAKEATCPVLLIPPNAKFKKFEQILFASGQAIIDDDTKLLTKQICAQYDAFGHIVHIEESESYQLKSLVVHHAGENITFKSAQIASPSIIEGINTYIEHQSIDLAVIFTKHRNILENLLHKSMTKKMILHATTPLLVMHINN